MPARKNKKTLDEWRAYNYSVNYDLRGQFKALNQETQEKYALLAFALPPWKLNQYGAPVMDSRPDVHYECERRMIELALENRLPDAWFLCMFYTSEAGWEEYVRQFNSLEEDETFPKEKHEQKQALFSPQMPVDN